MQPQLGLLGAVRRRPRGRLRRLLAALLADDSFVRAMAAVACVPLPLDLAVVVTAEEFDEIERWLATQAPHGVDP